MKKHFFKIISLMLMVTILLMPFTVQAGVSVSVSPDSVSPGQNGLLESVLPLWAQPTEQADGDQWPIVSDPVVPQISPALRNLPTVVVPGKQREINPLRNFFGKEALIGTDTDIPHQDPLADRNVLNPNDSPSTILNFEGMGNFCAVMPPDTTGDVGPNHYVQQVNSSFAIYDKSGTLLAGPTATNALWTGAGGYCETYNHGDGIVLYDDMADRWLISQFALPSGSESMCIAISQTSDPTGAYYLYEYLMPDFPDYPKFGVWPDAYYLGTNTGSPNQYYAHAFDRISMLAGSPAQMVSFGGNPNFPMPADADGTTSPPVGAPGYFYTHLKSGYVNHPPGVDRLAIYEFDVDWVTPANSTFTLATEIPISAFDYTTCGFFVQDCIPQPPAAGGQRLDAVDPWPMVRLQYRNFGSYETMVGNFTYDVDGTDHAGIRWFELHKQGASPWSLYQEGTWADTSGDEHRWMGSIAMDGSGNIALGYSVSGPSTAPAIRYAVRQRGDLLGTLQAEASVVEGPGVQTGGVRWGDYSAMNVDPVDNCTFWVTNEYHAVDDPGFCWDTKIASFRIPGCTGSLGPVGYLDGTVTDNSTSNPIAGASVQAAGLVPTHTNNASSDAIGYYRMLLPTDTYTVSAVAYGYQMAQVSGVSIVSGTTTTVDIALASANTYVVSGTVTDATTGWPLYALISIGGDPVGPPSPYDEVWTDPATGYYSITLAEGITYTLTADAWVSGYDPESRQVAPLTGDRVEDFGLLADLVACTAPGYEVIGTCVPRAGGLVVGNIYDDNTLSPLVGAEVANEDGYMATSEATPNDDNVDDGFYTVFSPQGSKTFTSTMSGGYGPDVVGVTVVQSDTVWQDFYLLAGYLIYNPGSYDITQELGMSMTLPFTLNNTGGYAADFELVELDEGMTILGPFERPNGIVKPHKQDHLTSEGVSLRDQPQAAPLAAGDIIQSWPINLTYGWGLGYNTWAADMWIGNVSAGGGDDLNYRFLTDGTNTGDTIDTSPWVGTWAADMTYNPNTGMLWQVDVGGDNCVHEMDPVSMMSTSNTICPAFGTSQRGLAYDPTTDVYFAGSWNDQMIYRFAPNGTILESVLVGLDVAGLAYNPDTEHLFVMSNATPNPVYVLDAADGYNILGQFSVTGFSDYGGAGFEMDCDGNLWGVDQETQTVYQFESGETTSMCSFDVPWLSEDPISGTIASLINQAIDITFDAGQVTQPGIYNAQLKISHDTPYDLANVPMTMTVTAPATWGRLDGTVTSLGYCDADPAPLEAAEVLVEGSSGITWTITTDISGTYSYWFDEAESPLTVTVTSPDHEVGLATGVMITGAMTTTQNFDLRWLVPCVDVQTPALEATLDMGLSTTFPVSITNTGAAPLNFQFQEKDEGFTPMLIASVASDFVPRERLASYDPNATTTDGVLAASGNQPLDLLAAGDVLAQWPSGLVLPWGTGFSLDEEMVWLSNPGGAGGDDNNHEFDTGGTPTGRTVSAAFGGDWGGDIAYNPNTGMFWQVNVGGDNCIYEWDPTAGATGTSICNAAWTWTSQRGLAYDPEGDAFFIGGWNDSNVYYIDDTGAVIQQWTLNLSVSGLAYNWVDGLLFIMVNDAPNSVSVFDVGSGTVINTFSVAGFGDYSGAGLAIDVNGNLWAANQGDLNAYLIDSGVPASLGSGDVPWLYESPITGTLPADTGFIVADVTLDANYVGLPGVYSATLTLNSDDPVNDSTSYPVVMTVTLPATYGMLEGTVTGLGYCDVNPTPLDGADVLIEGSSGMSRTLTTDASGYYGPWWFDEAESPMTVTVTYPNHEIGGAYPVMIIAQTTTTVDFDLRWLEPCVDVQAPVLEATLDMGLSTTLPMTITNEGAGALDFEFGERDRGFVPLAPTAGGGPDAFGYIYRDSAEPDGPTFEWVEIAPPLGGSGVSASMTGMDDDHIFPIPVSFPFNFYGTDYTQLAFGSNGTIYFEDIYLGYGNVAIPGTNSYGVNTFIAHYWDDLVIDATGEVYYLDEGDRIIVEYYNARRYGGSDLGSWEIILFGNGNILFQYLDAALDYGASATVGIQGDTVTGLQYSYNTPALSDGLAICFAYPGEDPSCVGPDVPWLSEDPITGTVSADSLVVVDVTFDAGQVPQPGDYYATLSVKNNDPFFGNIGLPVTLTVNPPATWGKLEGTVTGLGYCDVDPAVLDGADVLIEGSGGMTWTVTTDISGTYSYWLDETESPLTVTVTYPNHTVGSATGVMITAQMTTTLDFDLRWLEPCIDVDVPTLEAVLDLGLSTTLPVTITNWGAGELDFALADTDAGMVPLAPLADALWLSEDPVTGTLAADGGQTMVDVTLDAALVPMPAMHYYATLDVSSNDPVSGYIGLPVTMTVNAPADWGKLEGTVTSLGYCDADPAPLEGVDVLVETSTGMSWTLTTAPDGYYTVWMTDTESPITVSVAPLEHELGLVTGVVITAQATTTEDFDLRWLVPCVDVTPPDLSAVLDMGMSTTLPLTVTNWGAGAFDFTLREADRGMVPLAPQAANILLMLEDIADWTPYRDALTAAGTAWAEWNLDTLAFPTAGDLVPYDILIWGDEGTLSPGDTECQIVADWLQSGDKSLFATSVDFLWDLQNGTPGAGEHNLYLLFNTTYLGDYAGTGILTLAGVPGDPIGGGLTLQLAGNADSNGDYVDETIGAPTGFLYGTGGAGSGRSALTHYKAPNYRTVWLGVNFHNGLTTQSERDQLMMNVIDFLAGGVDVPWLSEDPITGTLAADGGQIVVDVTFNTLSVTHPAMHYYATLNVSGNDPYGPFGIPVTMTINAPSDWGKLEGTVISLGYCDANPTLMEGMDVFVESSVGTTWTLTTNADGYYAWWMSESESPFTVTVAPPDYEMMVYSATISAQTTTTVDFDMRWLAPCVDVAPTSMEAILSLGTSEVQTLTIYNDGAASSDFVLRERLGTPVSATVLRADVAPDFTPRERLAGYNPNATTTDGVLAAGGSQPLNLLAAGDVLAQWPSGLVLPWGTGFGLDEEMVWLGNPVAGGGDDNNHEFDTGGTLTGRTVSAVFGGDWGGDITYNPNTGMFWQVNVGGDNCIYEWDPASGATGATICGAGTWSVTSQRGLAYDPDTDTYFVGGWNDDMVYHIDNTGAVLATWAYAGGISGLAYNWEAGLLFVMENSATDTITVVDPSTWTVVNSFTVVGFGGFAGAGLAIDVNGNLWAANQTDLNAYLIDSGVPADLGSSDVPWLSENPITGTVSADGMFDVAITFTALPTMTDGIYTATLRVNTDDPVIGRYELPMTMTVVVAPLCGFESSSPDELDQTTYFTNTTLGAQPMSYTWSFGDGTMSAAINPTHVYTQANSYTVTLTADNPYGQDVCSDVVTVYQVDYLIYLPTVMRNH